MDKILSFLEGQSLASLSVLLVGLLALLHVLPNTIRKLGIIKLGPLEMEHKHQTLNYEINRKIDEIDINNRERLWDMTEDIFAVASEKSTIKCEAAVGYILSGVSSPIRNMVLLNHIAPKLVKSEEDVLRAKICRGISRAVRDAKHIVHGKGCPVSSDVSDLSVERYTGLIEDWMMRARSITSKACKEKLKVYQYAVDNTKDKYWVDVYRSCILKNKSYIKGMGYEID